MSTIRIMEDILIGDNEQDTYATRIESSAKEKAEQKPSTSFQEQADTELQPSEQEITREQLSLGKRLLNWRTLVPLVVVIIALVYFAQKQHIDVKQTWLVIRHANLLFFLAAFAIYY